jgi:hypothetical protein
MDGEVFILVEKRGLGESKKAKSNLGKDPKKETENKPYFKEFLTNQNLDFSQDLGPISISHIFFEALSFSGQSIESSF